MLYVFLKDTFSYLGVCVVVISLFVFYYFTLADYWFLCSVLTIVLAGVCKVFFISKKRRP
uniref:Uncharacterized protein n=1 Tax=Edwardsiella tarda TaxID=636 RepID=A0A2S1PMD8_EDWTA|nr:hypothetical protein [Edwardsiella tarda]